MLVFHIYHGQWKLFFCRPYYLCLMVLAGGGVVAAIPLNGFYNPLQPGNGLAIFQVRIIVDYSLYQHNNAYVFLL